MPLPFAEVAADSSREATRSQAEGSKTMAGKTIAEQIAALKATRDELAKKMDEVAQKSVDEGRSMNTAEGSEFDDAEAQIKTLDLGVPRLTGQEARRGRRATPAGDLATANSAAARPTAVVFPRVK